MTEEKQYEYDLIVLGGGSGGLSAAKEAKKIGVNVCVMDFVKPTPRGTTWGLGGTCVNVGCIPKKLMHQASLLGDAISDASAYGWEIPKNISHNWEKLRKAVYDHIRSVNWVLRVELKDKSIDYLNAFGTFIDPHTIKAQGKEIERIVTGKYILIAIGCRPNYPDIPGALEFGVTSDDIFKLPNPPGKTAIVGAGYVALECSGFLRGLGYDTTILMRSRPLRGFDLQMSELVKAELEERGVKFLVKCLPVKLEQSDDKLKLTYKNEENIEDFDTFDTVVFAIGRYATTSDLMLEKAGVITAKNGKIDTVNEQTNVKHIYAVGDVLNQKPELTPVAILAGRFLARRLFATSTQKMDYNGVPTTIFTPLEYGSVGMAEEEAIERYGEDHIEVYHGYYRPTEFSIPHRSVNNCYLKIITKREHDQYVLGMHFIGPNAGEVIQGFAAALRLCVSYKDLIDTIAIHPTVAEEFTRLHITKRSASDPNPTACCS